jgi:MFS family permease
VLLLLSKGVPIENVGILMAVMSASVVAFELPSGVLSDLLGRKRIYLFSILLQITGYVIVLWTDAFIGLTIGFFLAGVARAFSSGSIESNYIDAYIGTHGKEKLHTLISSMYVAEALGLAIGALGGGFIPMIWKWMHPVGNMYRGNLAVQISILIILLIVTIFSGYDDRGTKHTKLKTLVDESKSLVRSNNVIRVVLFGAVSMGCALSALETFWQPYVKTILGSDEKTWIFGCINGAYFVLAIVGSLSAGYALNRLKIKKLYLVGLTRILIGAAILVMAFQNTILSFTIFFLAVMFGNGFRGVPEDTMLNAEIPNEKRASLLSLTSLLVQFGGICAALVFSVIKRYTTINVIWIITGVLMVLSSLFYFAGDRKEIKQSTLTLIGGGDRHEMCG